MQFTINQIRTFQTPIDIEANSKEEAMQIYQSMRDNNEAFKIEYKLYNIVSDKYSLIDNEHPVAVYKDGTEVFEGDLFARQCDITGEGMNEGWVINGGNMYIKYEDDAKAFVEREWSMTMDEAYNDDEDSDGFYWTEFEDLPDDYQYKIVKGQLTDIDFEWLR